MARGAALGIKQRVERLEGATRCAMCDAIERCVRRLMAIQRHTERSPSIIVKMPCAWCSRSTEIDIGSENPEVTSTYRQFVALVDAGKRHDPITQDVYQRLVDLLSAQNGCPACQRDMSVTFTLTDANGSHESALPLGTHYSSCATCGREIKTLVFTLDFGSKLTT